MTGRRSHPTRAARKAFWVLGAVALVCLARFWYLEEQGNFHITTPGEAYRSSQMDRDELESYIKKYGIRSIINLRGRRDSAGWYREENEVCRETRTRHYDLKLASDRAPSEGEIKELLKIYETAPRPVLIHCQAGADRSGLAAALWKMVVDGAPKSEARKQLSVIFGHIPIGRTRALDEFLENWHPPQSGQSVESVS
jgi:protein tyrosine/serine phosphatase